jgi:hypothetical protein
MKINSVTALTGFRLQVMFDDGVSGIIDLSDFIETGIFSSLKDIELFNKVYTNGYSIAWSDELEIDALNAYAEILNKDPKEKLNVNTNYASN